MTHRILRGASPFALALPALLIATQPVSARAPLPTDERGATAWAERINDPAMQARIADTMSVFTRAILAMPIGGLADAMRQADPDAVRRDIPRDATVGDMIARDDPNFSRDLDGNVRRGTRMAGAMAGAMAQALPALKGAMRGILEGAIDGMGDDRY